MKWYVSSIRNKALVHGKTTDSSFMAKQQITTSLTDSRKVVEEGKKE